MRGRKVIMDKAILVIAGSDSCSGAGAQIDLKTAAAHGVHAACALTAVTAQNTREVLGIQCVDADMVVLQMRAAFEDLDIAAVKIGMLGSGEVARAVADGLAAGPQVPVVLDPVLVATAGGQLTDADALTGALPSLLARAALITPNLPEAASLTGVDVVDEESASEAAAALMGAGAQAVLLKGGHAEGEVLVDRLFARDGVREYRSKRLPGEYHGTGCSLSTAIACNLARGAGLEEAVAAAHAYFADALQHPIAQGHGSRIFNPLNKLEHVYGTDGKES